MGLRRLPRIEVIEAIDDVNQSATFRANEGVIKTEYKNFIIIVQATPRGERAAAWFTGVLSMRS